MKQIIIVRQDLKMKKGKLAAQACHASVSALVASGLNSKNVKKWFSEGQAKVCLKIGSEYELLALKDTLENANIICSLITDSGRTVFKEPTITCLGVEPIKDKVADSYFGHLSLL